MTARLLKGEHVGSLTCALGEGVDDVTWQTGADPVVGRDVELVPRATPEVRQLVGVRLGPDVNLFPVSVVSLVVDHIACVNKINTLNHRLVLKVNKVHPWNILELENKLTLSIWSCYE